MKELVIRENDAGQRLDRFLGKAVPALPPSLLQKYIRLKRIKVNGKRAVRDLRLQEGDCLRLFIDDTFFETVPEEEAFRQITAPTLDILYEDAQILLLNKRPGQSVHSDERERVNTLISHLQAYLYRKGEWDPCHENAFAPALCNRIDRNTGGIVIAAKTAQALRILNEKIRSREITKYYLCITVGRPDPPNGELTGYLFKDAVKKQVYLHDTPTRGARRAVTRYRTITSRGELSLVECELITGRTHQIRAQFAHAGYPLLGDGKYGTGAVNRKYKEKKQALYSYKLTFDFPTDAECLNYLRGKTFRVKKIPFQDHYFSSSH